MFDQVVKVGNNGADDNEESIEQGDDEENEGEEEGENDNFGFDEPANGNQHLQLPPADADEQFLKKITLWMSQIATISLMFQMKSWTNKSRLLNQNPSSLREVKYLITATSTSNKY